MSLFTVPIAYARIATAIASEFLPIQAFRCVFDRDFARTVTLAAGAVDRAERLAEREAEVDVSEPVCPPCATTTACFVNNGCMLEEKLGPDADHAEALRRNVTRDPRGITVTVHNPALAMHNEYDRLCAYSDSDHTENDAICGVCRPVRDIVEQMLSERFGDPEAVERENAKVAESLGIKEINHAIQAAGRIAGTCPFCFKRISQSPPCCAARADLLNHFGIETGHDLGVNLAAAEAMFPQHSRTAATPETSAAVSPEAVSGQPPGPPASGRSSSKDDGLASGPW